MRGSAAVQSVPPNEQGEPPPVTLPICHSQKTAVTSLLPGHAMATTFDWSTRTITCECGWQASEPEAAMPVTVYRQALAHLRAVDHSVGEGEI